LNGTIYFSDTTVSHGSFVAKPTPLHGKVVEVYTVTDIEECAVRCADKPDCTAFAVDSAQSCNLINTLHPDILGPIAVSTIYELAD
jgi:hypothetical protein